MVWALLSMSMIGGGWVYCSRKMESTRVLCETGGCKIEDLRAGETTVLIIPRHKMVRGALVEVKNGEGVNPFKLRKSAQRQLGHSYKVVYLQQDSQDDEYESYDSFEDDDDSYDSYDGDDDSSEEDDDDYEMAVMAQRANERLGNAIPSAGGPSGTKAALPIRHAAQARREAELALKDARRVRRVKEREERGLPPIIQPDEQDEQQRQKATAGAGGDVDDEERFPGDAATLREKSPREIRNMEEARGMTAEEHHERGQQAFEEAVKAHKEMQRRDQQRRRMGNNLDDRAKPQPGNDNNNKPSPDDPDNNPPSNAGRPPLERVQAQKDLNVNEWGGAGGGGAAAGEDKLRKAGGTSMSSVEGLEEFDNQETRWLSPSPPRDQDKGEEEDQGLDEGGRLESFGDVVQHVGAAGSRRKLLSWKNRVKEAVLTPSKPTEEELAEDASKSRETHRQGHDHRQRRARKVAQPTGPGERADGTLDGQPKTKTKHHHKAFHHKEDVPQALQDRQHVHPRFHHRPGDKKIEHGWRREHRQWHHREELKKLGTPFSLGRTVARKLKEAIDSYVSRRVSTLDFTDSKKWRAGGLWLIIVGCISIAFCIAIGNFQPRHSAGLVRRYTKRGVDTTIAITGRAPGRT